MLLAGYWPIGDGALNYLSELTLLEIPGKR